MKARPAMMITGAAGGLGLALARQAAADYRVALVDIDAQAGEAAAAALRQNGAQAFFCAADVRDENDLRHASDRLLRRWGRLDVLVNSAGVLATGAFETLESDSWETLWQTNVMGAIRGCRAVLPAMKRQGSGHLLNVAALAGFTAPPGMAGYAASSAALIAASETMAAELASHGIQVSVVCPDWYRSATVPHIEAPDPLSRARLERQCQRAACTVEEVAYRILKALPHHPLYVFPQSRARWLWRRKRLAPSRFVRRRTARDSRSRGD